MLSTAVIAVLVLAACGGGDDDATPTPSLLPTTTTGAALATPKPGEITVAMLVDRIGAAWPAASSITVTTTVSDDAATPVATPSALGEPSIVTEVDSEGNRRVSAKYGDMVVSELIAIRGRVWALGYQFWGLPDEAAGPAFGDGWVEINTQVNDAVSNWSLSLISPYPPVYSNLDDSARARVVQPIGKIEAGGRSCDAYIIPDTTETGEPADVTIALDDAGLPCMISTDSLGQKTTAVYEFNLPVAITEPSTTPSASPIASPVMGG